MSVQAPVLEPVEATPASCRLFLAVPTWIRAGGAQTNGVLSLIEQIIPAGMASPWHIHHNEDESFYVIEGKVTVVVADRAVALGPGDYAFGPRGVPHGFRVDATQAARMLLMTTGGTFAEFILEMSEPADATSGEPRDPDLPKLIAAAERYGISILGPMPG
jgi:mannose-6-phosphate isomerase-like protein (cupin superfamily)